MSLRVVKETAIILLIAIILAIGAFFVRPTAPPPTEKKSSIAESAPENNVLYNPITIEHAEALFHQDNALFADARSLIDFDQHHISGAIHLDPYEIDQWADEMMARYPPDQIIITYCEGTNCDLSESLAQKLTWLGFEQVYHLNDGWTQWRNRGLPIEKK